MKKMRKGGKNVMSPFDNQAEKSLRFIFNMLCAVERGTVSVTLNGKDNACQHVYTLSTLGKMIKDNASVGLGLGLPKS